MMYRIIKSHHSCEWGLGLVPSVLMRRAAGSESAWVPFPLGAPGMIQVVPNMCAPTRSRGGRRGPECLTRRICRNPHDASTSGAVGSCVLRRRTPRYSEQSGFSVGLVSSLHWEQRCSPPCVPFSFLDKGNPRKWTRVSCWVLC